MATKCFLGWWYDKRVTDKCERENTGKMIIDAYENMLVSCAEIASWIPDVTRANVHRFLKRHGIDTSDRKRDVICHWCEKSFQKTRKRVRVAKRHFCTKDCYCDWLIEIGMDYSPNRHGQRIARTVVKQYFDLQPEHKVHHEDKTCLNNAPWNLRVFRDGRDHIHYHRKYRDVVPLWDGSKEHLHI